MTWNIIFTCFGPDDNGRIVKLNQSSYTGNATFTEMQSYANEWGNRMEKECENAGDEFDRIDEIYEDWISLCYTTDSMFILCLDAHLMEK